ncbi:ABC transporter permease [Arthrobacter sp. Sa2BUA2]|uniref:ABC transporter permease n=1 Tax=Arthrobacter pullicola TaxID=2762224 RepID=A0ABR8YL38_9MICC|nr:ABC transporter permease [Arthrobacter pullicola]MBD8044862.1 ABC transporter permease [Arthrobacter pullicola]
MDATHTPPAQSPETRQVPHPGAAENSRPAPDRRRSARTPLGSQLERFALPLLLVLIIVFFGVFPASSALFLSTANVSVVLANQSVVTLVAVALIFPLVAGHFDFSVGGIAVMSSVVTAAAMAHFSLPLWVSCLLGVAAAAVVGAVNGLLVARFKMNAFVSTLGMATLLGGLIQWYTGGLAIIGVDPAFTTFGSSTWLGLPRVVFVVAVLVFLAWYLLTHTPFGRSLYAIGSNNRAAVLVGLPLRRYTQTAFILSGTLAGLAGVILAARTGGANADNGTYLLFPALAAVFLGATAILPGRFNVVGTVFGVLFVAVSVSGLTLSGAANWVDQVFNGAALLVAVGLSSYLGRRRSGQGT